MNPRGVMAKILDCSLEVSEFEIQSHYHDYFRTNTFEKGKNSFIVPTSYGLNSATAILIEWWLRH